MIHYLRAVFVRDLRALGREVAAYPSDADLWVVPDGIANSAGTLALHLCGNLRHFIGALLGATRYVRDRDAEFARRDVPRAELAAEVERTIADLDATFGTLDAAALERPFPAAVAGRHMDTGDFLVHLVAHTGYHLGQIDYHRRLVTGTNETVGAIAATELASAREPQR